MLLEILLVKAMNYIGTKMNKLVLLLFCICIASATNMYWDLGVAIASEPNKLNVTNSIDLSTYHRIEGLKKYYSSDFMGALFHFEELNAANKPLVLYEYIDSYYLSGDCEQALLILNDYNNLSDNLLYLKSQILVTLEHYDEALLVLELLQSNFIDSDYTDIIKFDLEKIYLLK